MIHVGILACIDDLVSGHDPICVISKKKFLCAHAHAHISSDPLTDETNALIFYWLFLNALCEDFFRTNSIIKIYIFSESAKHE
jgi:hypothetical protein